jgi:hypothetical protein
MSMVVSSVHLHDLREPDGRNDHWNDATYQNDFSTSA